MVLRSHSKQNNPHANTRAVDSSTPIDNPFDNVSEPDLSSTIPLPPRFSFNQFDTRKLKDEQEKDLTIQNIITEMRDRKNNLPFVLKNNILYKLVTPSSHSKKKIEVIYLPSSMTKCLLQACHDDPMTGAHFSFERTYNKIKHLYWWPHMKFTIKSYIASCVLCKQYNISRHKKYGYLRPITPPEGPFVMIGIDYCGPLARTPRENQYVLVITDYFTRHVTAIALPNCTAETTAQALFNEYFCKYGVPSVILSDQGSHFRNQLMENIKALIGYNHIYSTPYHPQTNGIVERFNATFIPQISKLQDTQHNNWDEYLQAVVFAYNTGIHKSTKYSPYELLYGRSPRLPITTRPTHFSFVKPNDYFEQLKKTLRIYHQAARYHMNLQQQIHKKMYDHNRLNPQYHIGDKVLTRIHRNGGKLEPKFSLIPKIITQVYHPIYEVQDEETQVFSQVHVADLRPILTP
jgi:transposase InsO family protein